ncbi:UNVERIFIED_CONTAM: hypothetical protein NCL1_35822 [Trichonephila clavipes]
MMIPAYNRKGALLSIRDGNPSQAKVRLFSPKEDTTMPYSGFEPEPTRLQAESHIHHTVHIRVIPLNEDALPSDRPIKLQIKNPNGTTVEETHFTKGKTSKFQTAFARHMYKFPNFPIMGEWTATVHYGYKLEQSSTVHFELQEYGKIP